MKNKHLHLSLILTLSLLCNGVLNAQIPSVKSISPDHGYPGQVIDIKGFDFEAGSRVFFGSVEGTVVNSSNQLIQVVVPSGGSFENISILNPSTGLSAFSNDRFYVAYGGTKGINVTNFDAQVDFAAESGLFDLCICDLNGDQLNDIIGANTKNTKATILRNFSTPTNLSFSKTPIELGATTLNATCADLNGDGKPEVILTQADNGNRVFLLENFSTLASIAFVIKTITITGATVNNVVVNDLDLDGKPDLIVTDQSKNNVYLVKNSSTGGSLSFSTSITTLPVTGATSTSGIDVQDINGDKRPDIVTSQFLTDNGGVFFATNNSTAGTFSFSGFTKINTTGTIVNIKLADINGDQKPEIVTSLFLSNTMGILTNQTSEIGGAPVFSSVQNLAVNERPWGFDFGDLDGDGIKDISISTVGASLSVNVLNGNSPSSVDFQKVDLPSTFINRNIKSADVDGDGKPDLIFTSVDDESKGIAASKISILRNNKCIVPVVTPSGPLNACAGNEPRLEAQLIAGATFEWRRDGTVEKTSTDNFIDATTSGNYTVTIIMESGACSEISGQVEVTIGAAASLPTPVITNNNPACIGGTMTLTSDDVGATEYQWRGPNGFTDTGINAELTDFKSEDAGIYYLDVYAGTCLVETQSTIVEIVESPDFFSSQSGSGSYCDGDAISLSVFPDDSNFSYQWFNENGSIVSETNTTFSPTSSGTYYVEVTDLVNTSCPVIKTNEQIINIVNEPIVDFSFPASACTNSSVSFTDLSTTDNAQSANYLWEFGDGQTSTSQNPSHTYNSANSYNVKLTVSYIGLNCSASLTKTITINGSLNIEILAEGSAICEGDELELSLATDFASYQWNNGETSESIIVSEGGTYSVDVVDSNGCVGTDEIQITEFPAPQVSINASENNVKPGTEVTLSATGLSQYLWAPDSNLTSAIGSETVATVNSTTLYTVSGSDQNGCEGTAQIEIIVIQENPEDILKPKKFFSPNGDASSQYWIVDNIEQFPDCGVEIYDQVGNKLYEAKPYNNDWDGLSNAQVLPEGVYYFLIKCSDDKIVKSGSITLLK